MSSTTAHLQPVRWPGSMPRTVLRAERRGEQELAQVLRRRRRPRRDRQRILSSTRTSTLHAGDEQALERVVDRLVELARERRAALDCRRALRSRARAARRRRSNASAQHALGFAAADREEAVRRDGRDRLFERRVHVELGGLVLVVLALGDAERAIAREAPRARACGHRRARRCARRRCRARRRAPRRRRAPPSRRSTNARRLALGSPSLRLRPDALGERLEPALARDRRARAALRLERQVEVLELGLGRGTRSILRVELGRELALLVDLGEDRARGARRARPGRRGAPRWRGSAPRRGRRSLLAVARDEGDGRAFARGARRRRRRQRWGARARGRRTGRDRRQVR